MAGNTRGGAGRERVRGRMHRLGLACGLALSGVMLGGCEVDSYLDPSVVGRWEMTPTTVPILNHLAIVEDADVGEVAYSEIEPRDLIPEPEAYRASPGDAISVTIFGLFRPNEPSVFEARVDQRGYISIPQVGEVFVRGLSREQVESAIARAAEDREIISDPVVAVTPLSERQRTFSLMGAVRAPGTYVIPEADYRLLEALAAGGGLGWPDADYVYVIRQVPLSEEAAGQTRPPQGEAPPMLEDPEGEQPPAPQRGEPAGEDLLEILDEIGQPPPVRPGRERPEDQPPGGAPDGGGSPSVFASGSAGGTREPLVDLDAVLAQPEDRADVGLEAEDGITWVYRDGRWVMVRRRQPGEAGAAEEAPLMTQRVLRVPVTRLISGDARVNLVVRPGDIIRIPSPPQGIVFMRGFVARPGTYGMSKKLTLTRAIDAAGGLSGLAIPERVDIVRMLPGDRQAWVRVNLREIENGTQPDIYLKANDRVNVGTNFWALPLAVVRGGFRSSYGFGFLLDRNFGNDVFGPPPLDRRF